MENDNGVSRLTVTKLPHINTIVIKQKGRRFFISTQDSVVIDVAGLSFLIKFLVVNNIISHRILEGILEEYRGLFE